MRVMKRRAPLILTRLSGRVELDVRALSLFEGHRQLRATDAEAGGILIGRRIVDSDDVIVDDVTVPSSGDISSRFQFVRAREPAQAVLNAAWQKSAGTQNYLGEWHTHPEDVPTPSHQDINNWCRIVSDTEFEGSSLLFVIVGRRSLQVWELSRSGELAHLGGG